MVSFFGLSLSCLNAGSRIIYPMARHGIFSGHLGKAHTTNRTPHIAITVYMMVIFLVPTFLEIFTNPLTSFGDAGTLAAFGFLLAYFLITMAAPVYLKKIGELRPGHVVLAVVAVIWPSWCPTIGSFYPLPPYPVRIFPYIFLAWMLVGRGVAVRGQPAAAGDPPGHRSRPRTRARARGGGDRHSRCRRRSRAGHRGVATHGPSRDCRWRGCTIPVTPSPKAVNLPFRNGC